MKAVGRIGAVACSCLALWLVVQPRVAAASAASDVVRGFYQNLMENMRSGPSLGQQGRAASLPASVAQSCSSLHASRGARWWPDGVVAPDRARLARISHAG